MGLSVTAVGSLFALAGCSAEDPAEPKPAAGGAASGGSGGAAPVSCDVPCVPATFKAKCNLCHGKALMLGGPLDFESPGYTERLKDKPAVHTGFTIMPAPGACPTGDMLISTANPNESWFLKKLTNQFGTCGDAMPQSLGALSTSELECMKTYVACVAGKPLTPSSGGSGAGGAATGGTGGAATGGTSGAATGGGGSGGTATGGTGGTGGGTAGTGGT